MMEDQKQKFSGSVIVNTQYIKDLSFENPKAPYSFLQSEHPSIDVALEITVHSIQPNSYEVVLGIQTKALLKSEIVFLTDVKYAGIFTIESEVVDAQEKEMILSVHCPTILFPYARRIISDVTRDGGYPTLMIAPVDFLGLYLQRKDNAMTQLDSSSTGTIN